MARNPARTDGPWLFCLVVGAGGGSMFCRAEVARNHQPEVGIWGEAQRYGAVIKVAWRVAARIS
ncbi:unnamed protein product [Ectocarpus sp. CCAP 1310/34]|nr:unnamed protein product [Ectocarpus sp. CCAP 1310/34]